MFGSFLAGVALAFGHHFFYLSLDKKPTGNAIFQQQVNTNIGTALAFLVKMFLVIAVGAAYVQLFWRQVKAEQVAISRVDSLFALRSNALEFFSLGTLRRYPVLALIGLFSWSV